MPRFFPLLAFLGCILQVSAAPQEGGHSVHPVTTPTPTAPAPTPEASAPTPAVPAPTPAVPAPTPKDPALTPTASASTPAAPAPTPKASALTPEAPALTPTASALTPEASALTPEAPAPTPEAPALTPTASVPTPEASVPTPEASAPTPKASAPTPEAPAPTPETPAAAPAAPVSAPPALPADGARPAPVFSAVEKFDRALTAYNAGDYTSARRDFLELVDEGHLSASLAHNLGNIEYKSGNEGLASLWYRRALAMRPLSPETLQNLRFLRRRTGFQTWDSHGVSLSHLPPETVRNATLLTGWAALLLLVWLLWSPPRPGRRWPLVTLLLLLLPAGAVGGALWWLVDHDPHPLARRHVLTGGASAAYAAPAEASSLLISLPAGSEVMPLEARGNWFYCEIPTDADTVLRGWVRSAPLQPLWPYAAAPREW